MPVVSEPILLALDASLHAIGAILLALAGVVLLREARARRDILREPRQALGIDVVHIAGVLLLYLTLGMFIAWQASKWPLAREPGSPAWRMLTALDSGVRILCAAVMIALLWRYPAFAAARSVSPGEPPRTPRLTPLRLASLAIAFTLAALPLTYSQLAGAKALWNWLNPQVIQPTHSALQALNALRDDPLALAQIALTAIVVAPLVEELFFRGLLLQTLWRITGLAWPAIIVSSIAFGWIHHSQPQDVLPLVTFGLLLAAVRLRYRSLTLCILIHALFNARTVLVAILNPDLTEVW